MDWTTYLLFILLTILAVIGLIGFILDARVKKLGIPATAVLVRIQKNPKNSFLFFSFSVEGTKIEALYPFPMKKVPYEIGDSVDIVYLPSNPETFRLTKNNRFRNAFLLLFLLSIVLLGLTIYLSFFFH